MVKIKEVNFRKNVYEHTEEVFIKHCKRCKIVDPIDDLKKHYKAKRKELGIKDAPKVVKTEPKAEKPKAEKPKPDKKEAPKE